VFLNCWWSSLEYDQEVPEGQLAQDRMPSCLKTAENLNCIVWPLERYSDRQRSCFSGRACQQNWTRPDRTFTYKLRGSGHVAWAK
jgi:hypothetical protein